MAFRPETVRKASAFVRLSRPRCCVFEETLCPDPNPIESTELRSEIITLDVSPN